MKKVIYLLIAVLLMSGLLTACNGKVSITVMDGGGVLDTVEIKKGETLSGYVPEKQGYEFVGWFTDAGFISKFDIDTAIKKNTKLYAKYQKKEYELTFKAEGHADVIRRVLHGDTLTDIPQVPEKTGHTGAWDADSFENITAPRIVTAVYDLIQLTLTFKAEGHADIIRTVAYGGSLTDIPAVPSVTGKRGEWDTADFSSVISNLTIFAIYEDIYFTVTFLSELGGSRYEEKIDLLYGSSLSPQLRPQPYPFEGHTGRWEDAEYTAITRDFTVNAVYTPHTFAIRFRDPESSEVFLELEVAYGVKISDAVQGIADAAIKDRILIDDNSEFIPSVLKDGRNFNFRYGDKSLGADIESVVRTGCDFHLIYDTAVYVTLYLGGGALADPDFADGEPSRLLAGGVLAEPRTEPRYGYVFDGWFDAAEGGGKISFPYSLSAQDLTAYARWTKLVCDVLLPEIDGITFIYDGVSEGLDYGSGFEFEISADGVEILQVKADADVLTASGGVYRIDKLESDYNIAIKTVDLSIFTLRFYDEYGSLLYTKSVTQGCRLGKAPPLPERFGAHAVWFLDGAAFDFETRVINNNMDFDARYFYSNYTVTYDLGDRVEYGYITYLSVDFEFYSPKKDGMVFDGWFFDAALTERATKTAVAGLGGHAVLYPKWTAPQSLSHTVLGKWAGDLLLVELLADGTARINDGRYFFECAFSILDGKIYILGESLGFDGSSLQYRGRTLIRDDREYLFVELDGTIEMLEDDSDISLPVDCYWYYDDEYKVVVEPGEPLAREYILNNYIRLYPSTGRLVVVTYNAMDGYTDGNISRQEIYVQKNISVLPGLIGAHSNSDEYEFVGWAEEGGTMSVDAHYLSSFKVYRVSVYAVYRQKTASEKTLSGQYSHKLGDEIVYVEFFENGYYEIMFLDTLTLTFRRTVKSRYSCSDDVFFDAEGNPFTVGEDGVSMTLTNGAGPVTLPCIRLEYASSRYTRESDGTSVLELSETALTIDGIRYAPIYQSGTLYYFIRVINVFDTADCLDVSEWTPAELVFPTEMAGVYEGVYNMGGAELPFVLEVDGAAAVWIFEGIEPVAAALTGVRENKFYELAAIGHCLYFDDGGYYLAPIEGGGEPILLTKTS